MKIDTTKSGTTEIDTASETTSDASNEVNNAGAIDNILGFHIRLAHGTYYRHFMQSCKFLDMTQQQVSVLWLVSDHPGIIRPTLKNGYSWIGPPS